MKINITVKNLGQLKEGTIKIRPFTLLTGPNGTGKSFFTKSLYSIFNVVNKNVYHLEITRNISYSKRLLESFKSSLSSPEEADSVQIEKIGDALSALQTDLNQATELELQEYFNYAKSRMDSVGAIINTFDQYSNTLSKNPKKFSFEPRNLEKIRESLLQILSQLKKGIDAYKVLLGQNLSEEIKENFQIANLFQMVSFGENNAQISIDKKLAQIEFGKLKESGIGFAIHQDFINKISSLSRVVFFESPAYWRVREALKLAKEKLGLPIYLKQKENTRLTGVPKYFYDLDEALRENSKNENSTEIEALMTELEKELGGEFLFRSDELVFKDYQSKQEISKNLMSFGMVNLGMIHALLKNNVIKKGSYVFIDEPETNLHPDWQVLLMNTLIALAEKNINIIIASHSVDMLKALEVGLKNRQDDEDFLSVHYFDIGGQLLEFESNRVYEQLIEARETLSTSYEALYFKGAFRD